MYCLEENMRLIFNVRAPIKFIENERLTSKGHCPKQWGHKYLYEVVSVPVPSTTWLLTPIRNIGIFCV